MAAVAQFETLSYNGFAFPVESKITIQAEPHYDDAGRAVAYVVHHLSVSATISTTDNEAALGNTASANGIKARLMAPGQALTLRGTGYGDLSVNGVSPKKDVVWGPKPRLLSWVPLGVKSCTIIWNCDVAIPVCYDAVYEPLGDSALLAFNYSVATTVDSQGYCTRTVSGYLEIPETRGDAGGSAVFVGASRFWNGDRIPIPAVGQWRRTNTQTNESADRRRLTFTVVDTEIPDVILPASVVDCQASHSIRTQLKSLNLFDATIRGSYTLKKGTNKELAFSYFLALVAEKLRYQVAHGVKGILPKSLEAENPQHYGRMAGNFAFHYVYWVTANPVLNAVPTGESVKDIFSKGVNQSALWFPSNALGTSGTSGTSGAAPERYRKWLTSMDNVFGKNTPRFEYQLGNDVIVDLCAKTAPGNVKTPFIRVAASSADRDELRITAPIGMYLADDSTIIVDTSTNVFVKPRLIPPGFLSLASADPAATASLNRVYYGDAPQDRLTEDVQTTSPSSVTATLFYRRIVVGAQPKEPQLTEVGGSRKIVALGGRSARYQSSNHGGVPALAVVGWRKYQLTDVPNNIPDFPPNYYLDQAGTSYDSSSAARLTEAT